MSLVSRVVGLVLMRVRLAVSYHSLGTPLNRAHVGGKLLGLLVLWLGFLILDVPQALSLAPAVLFLAFSSPRPVVGGGLLLSLIPTSFVGVASMFLTPYPPLSLEWGLRSATLAWRTFGLSLSSLLVFASTSPLALAGLLARFGKAHDFVVLFYRSLPLTVNDVTEAISAQGLLGKPLHHTLVPSTLLALRRAEGLALSLYTRGYRTGPRTRVEDLGDPLWGALFVAVPLVCLALGLLL